MNHPIRVLSVYEGFFRGGARVLHSSIITSLHTRHDQKHSVFSIHSRVNRENTVQEMEDDKCYRHLKHCGITVSSLDRTVHSGQESDSDFSLDELLKLQLAVDNSDVVLVLKEQALPIINKVDTHGRPVILCVHRSDPENQGVGVEALQESLRLGILTNVVCLGPSGREAYVAAGVPESMVSVIPNGINLDKYVASVSRRLQVRRSLDIAVSAPVIVLAARYDDMKNIPLFLTAANLFLANNPSANFIVCGAGMTPENSELMADVRKSFGSNINAVSNMHFLGIRDDMPALYATSDIVSLTSSYGEAYPLCLLEGMATGAVPVSTDVGDTVEIVGNRGVITSFLPEGVAAGWQKALNNLPEYQERILLDRLDFDEARPANAYSQLLNSLYVEEAPAPYRTNVFLGDPTAGFANLA